MFVLRGRFSFLSSIQLDDPALSGVRVVQRHSLHNPEPETDLSPLHINLRAEDRAIQVVDNKKVMAFGQFLVLADLLINLPLQE